MKHILIVDDSTTMRRMIAAALRGLENVRFDEAVSGLEAIERLAVGKVDLMLLDMNMPDMHGLDVLKFIRGHSVFHRLPVLVLTTRGDEGTRSEALASGASLYMTKPFAPAELSRQVTTLLQGD